MTAEAAEARAVVDDAAAELSANAAAPERAPLQAAAQSGARGQAGWQITRGAYRARLIDGASAAAALAGAGPEDWASADRPSDNWSPAGGDGSGGARAGENGPDGKHADQAFADLAGLHGARHDGARGGETSAGHIGRDASRDLADLRRAQSLRHDCFITAAGLPPRPAGREGDAFDASSLHLLIEESASGRLRATCRLRLLTPAQLTSCYTAAFYDLRPLAAQRGPLLEVGRFCAAQGAGDPDLLRLAFAMIAAVVDAGGVRMLIGCSSFAGLDAAPYGAALARLGASHLGPDALRPRASGGVVADLSQVAAQALAAARAPQHAHELAASTVSLCKPTLEQAAAQAQSAAQAQALTQRPAQAGLPALLRSYLAMGAWVGADLVADPALNTLHVFTALETRHVPKPRARRLRALLAQEGQG